VDFPKSYSPVCYVSGDDEYDCDWHSDHDGDDDDDDEAYILSRDMNEDKNSEHVSICIIFYLYVLKCVNIVSCVCMCALGESVFTLMLSVQGCYHVLNI
jgi:hypothetical protein